MKLEVVLLYRADAHVQLAYERYAAVNEATAQRFLVCVDIAIDLISRFPRIGQIVRSPHRRLLIQGFPYGIFYTLVGNRIIVEALQDLRQDPETIAKLFK